MIEGLLRHGTDAEIEANYTDTHGASLSGSSVHLGVHFPVRFIYPAHYV
jgi:TnpA family transposase